jgi:hypothetical protein
MSKYVWTDDMREISGFGGNYEAGCRVMVVAGLECFDAHPDFEEPAFEEYKNVVGLISEKNPNGKKLVDAMVAAADRAFPNGGATGAMVQYCVHHVFKARELGWDVYASKMRNLKADEERAEKKPRS